MINNSKSDAYAAAGVDITAGYKAVELMKQHVARTATAGVCSDVGGFGGLFELDLTGISKPVLVSGTDGVGTKLKLAFLMDKHDTVGIDCVAMCVNDIVCCGARPIVFLDYIACGKNVPEKIASIVSGVADGCVMGECALVGGETAEMPGFYPEDEYDLAGYACGIVDRDRVIDKETVKPGDILIALPSSGVHSNGFSLVRKVFDIENADIQKPVAELGGKSLGEVLLTPTKIYVKPMLALLDRPTLGTYRLEGLDTATLSDADCAHLRATRLGLLSARVGLLPHETVVQNVALPLAYGGVARAERLRLAEEALLAVGLPPACFDVRAEELAQSQRCRVAIARAAASKPSVVLADEPTRGLGREDEEMVLEALVRLCDAGATVVVATCDEEVAVRCDRRVRLSGDGRLAGRVPLASGEGAGERGSS